MKLYTLSCGSLTKMYEKKMKISYALQLPDNMSERRANSLPLFLCVNIRLLKQLMSIESITRKSDQTTTTQTLT